MFSFLFRKNPRHEVDASHARGIIHSHAKLAPLYDGDRGIKDLYETSAELRLWIPELLKVGMTELTERFDTTISWYLRQFFVTYLYGAHDLQCMQDNKTGIFHPSPPSEPDNGIRFSRAKSVDYIPGLGKNIVPLKLFIHPRLKNDLQEMSNKAGIPLSQFAREILVSHFLGHTVWPERMVSWTLEQQQIADGWVEGRVAEKFISLTAQEEDAVEGKIEVLR